VPTPSWSQTVPDAHTTGDDTPIAPDWNQLRAAFLEVRNALQTVAVSGSIYDLTGTMWGIPSAKLVPATGSYTVSATDVGVTVEITASSAATFTLPSDAAVSLPVGTVVEVVRVGTGTVTVVPGTGVTVQSPTQALTARAQFSSLRLRKRAANTWLVSGDLTPDPASGGGGGSTTSPSTLMADSFAGSVWDASKWVTGGNYTFTVVGGAGRMTSVNSSGWHGEAKAVVSAVSNVGIVHRVRIDANAHVLRNFLRLAGDVGNYAQGTSNLNALSANYDNGSKTLALQTWTAGQGGSPTGAASVSKSLSANTWYWWRTEAVGSVFRTKMWADGTSEPSAWDTSGSVGITQAGAVMVTDAMYQQDASGWVTDYDDVTVYATS